MTPRGVKALYLNLSTLTIAVSDPSFQAGFEIGYRQYAELYAGKTLTDLDLLDIHLSNFAGVALTATSKIGVITGWYAALFGADLQTAGEQP